MESTKTSAMDTALNPLAKKRLFWHCVQGVCSFALANLAIAMFGDTRISFPEFYFKWTVFVAGSFGVIASVHAAFYDKAGDSTPEVKVVNPPTDPVHTQSEDNAPQMPGEPTNAATGAPTPPQTP